MSGISDLQKLARVVGEVDGVDHVLYLPATATAGSELLIYVKNSSIFFIAQSVTENTTQSSVGPVQISWNEHEEECSRSAATTEKVLQSVLQCFYYCEKVI